MTLPVPPSLRGYHYKPRTIGFQGARAFGRWQVKGTVITVRGTAAHFADVVEAAWVQAERLLDAIPEGGADAGVASLILHVGLAGVWLLLDWWEEGDILMHRHFHAPIDDPTRFADVAGRHLGPCVVGTGRAGARTPGVASACAGQPGRPGPRGLSGGWAERGGLRPICRAKNRRIVLARSAGEVSHIWLG